MIMIITANTVHWPMFAAFLCPLSPSFYLNADVWIYIKVQSLDTVTYPFVYLCLEHELGSTTSFR